MDKISSLPDECLVSIISFLPTKVAVSTSVLSKRWECLWMWMLKLEYYDGKEYTLSESEKLRCFLHRSLPLHKARVMEKLSLKFSSPHVKPEDINIWVVVAASRCIRELEISYSSSTENPIILPSSLFNNKSLVILKLKGKIIVEIPRNVCLPSLKTLHLESLTYAGEESLQRLVSICPVLKDLLVNFSYAYRKGKVTVFDPSLQRLTLIKPFQSDRDELVINTPSLEYLKLDYQSYERHYYVIENMPKLVEAYVDVIVPNVKSLIGSITSVKRLTLCLASSDIEVVLGEGFIFNQVEHLKLCLCGQHSANLLIRMLKISPNLRILEFFITEDHEDKGYTTSRIEPTIAPECVLSTLQIFNWYSYLGTPEERDFAVYILKTARCLKTVRISSDEDDELIEVSRHEMLKELALSSRASTTCQLIFE